MWSIPWNEAEDIRILHEDGNPAVADIEHRSGHHGSSLPDDMRAGAGEGHPLPLPPVTSIFFPAVHGLLDAPWRGDRRSGRDRGFGEAALLREFDSLGRESCAGLHFIETPVGRENEGFALLTVIGRDSDPEIERERNVEAQSLIASS